MQPKTAIIIAAGNRGTIYARYDLEYPNEMKIVGVAEPIPERRNYIRDTFNLSEDQCFSSWEEILEQGKLADIAIISTMDQDHYLPTLKALELGYHVLLEKPMSPNPREVIEMDLAAKKYNRKLSICHVLRYTDFWSSIREIIQSGKIGDVVSVQLNENVEIMHYAHSFVRGNWRKKADSSPMILQKSCHDMDILNFIMDKKCVRVSSFGSLSYFKEENAPEGAPHRCLDGCPVANECPFHAGRYYLDKANSFRAGMITEDKSREGIVKALRETDFGKCVFRSNNDVVDHQVVNLEFEDGSTATFSMCGFTRDETRTVQIMGTKGEIRGSMVENKFSYYDFLTKRETVIHLPQVSSGHGGGDFGIVRSFLRDIDAGDDVENISSSSVSVWSHLMAFAAEESRLNKGEPVDIEQFYQEITDSIENQLLTTSQQ